MDDREQLEFLAREYKVVTENLIELFERIEPGDVPDTIKGALIMLASAINKEWG